MFPSTSSGETSGLEGNKTNWFPEIPYIKCFVIYLDFPSNNHMAKTCCCIRRAGNNCMTKNQPITMLVLLSESLDITIWVLDRIINFSCIKKLTRVIICLLSANQAFSLRKVSDITIKKVWQKQFLTQLVTSPRNVSSRNFVRTLRYTYHLVKT